MSTPTNLFSVFPETLAVKLFANARAVKLASIKTEPANIPKTQRCYVELALKVAEGTLI